MGASSQIARKLRRNQTDAERRLWLRLRDRRLEGFKFRRQFPIGKYVVDFVCLDAHGIVEIDGGEHGHDDHDKERDRFLEANGFVVVRFWNHDVMKNVDGVCQERLSTLRVE